MEKTWLVPEYYPRFLCKADKCRHTCCSRWRIPVSKKEYHKLITMECGEQLNHRIQSAFQMPAFVNEEVYRYIAFNWMGNCPIQEEGFCLLHKEKGEVYLPKVCRLYPRSLKKINDQYYACCSGSCEKVIELLYDVKKFEMIPFVMDEENQLVFNKSEEEMGQIEIIRGILRDEKKALKEKLYGICEIFGAQKQEDEDPLGKILSLLKIFENSDEDLKEIIEEVVARYKTNPFLYKKDVKKFEEDEKAWMGFFERMIENSLLYENNPLFSDKENARPYNGLCLCYGMLRVLCVGDHVYHPEREALIDVCAAVFRLVEHTPFYVNVSALNENVLSFLEL